MEREYPNIFKRNLHTQCFSKAQSNFHHHHHHTKFLPIQRVGYSLIKSTFKLSLVSRWFKKLI